MNVQDQFRQLIEEQQSRLRAGVPPYREAALLALLRARDRWHQSPETERLAGMDADRCLAELGGNKALHLCFASAGDNTKVAPASSGDGIDDWGEEFLLECGLLAEAELVLSHCETGFMRMVDDGNGTYDAWIATKRAPTRWRERADLDWWASWLARRHGPELSALRSQRPDMVGRDPEHDVYYRELANVHLKVMAYQLDYPPDAVIGGCTVQTYRDVLGWLIGWALKKRDRKEPVAPQSRNALVAAIASDLAVDSAVIVQAVAGFTLDRDGAAWHAAVPGIAAAPLVRVGPDLLAWSVEGLTTEPLLFLARELKRLSAQEYHNVAYLREADFRRDLYALFQDRRFVTSTGMIKLRRENRNIRTDIDAVVFDRKTGTLGLFELKSQDPFARTNAELARQRDSFLYANHQISGVLDWLNRNGADEILGRIDTRTARTFRVQRIVSLCARPLPRSLQRRPGAGPSCRLGVLAAAPAPARRTAIPGQRGQSPVLAFYPAEERRPAESSACRWRSVMRDRHRLRTPCRPSILCGFPGEHR